MVKPGSQSGATQEVQKVETPKVIPVEQPKPRPRAEPVEKKEKVDTTYWLKTTKEQRDELVEFKAMLKRLMKWVRLDPENEQNIKHNRQEPALLKKGVELMEKIL